MMMKEFVRIWKKQSLLSQAFSNYRTMMEEGRIALEKAIRSFFNGKIEKDFVYDEDRKINRLEMEVRRKILEHLSINPEQDVTSSLVLLTVIRGAERIGDQAKNIADLGELYGRKIGKESYFDELRQYSDSILKMFDVTITAFFNSNKEEAEKVVGTFNRLSKKLDEMIVRIFRDKLEAKKAVVCALMARHLKRVGAYLTNIANTVINPFDRMDYRDKEIKKGF